MKKLLAVILSFSICLGLFAVPTFAITEKTSGYDNLNQEAGELVIGFLGGSITVADGDSNSMGLNRYATRVTNWFQEQYPEKTVTQVNAGIGGTGSNLGKYRVMTDIGAYAPDVVFIEYAVNDAYNSALYSESVRSDIETIVRSLQSLPKVPVIVFLYSMHDNSYSNIKYTSIPDHQAVADYYNIETINFYEYMSDLVEKGDFIWDKTQEGSLTSDNIHPNALGHEQYGNYIISQLESRDILHENYTNLPRGFMFATKDTRDIKFADADNLEMTGTWENGVAGQSNNKYEAILATATNDTVSFTYESSGNDCLGVTLIGGNGTWILDEGTENEMTGELTGASNSLPLVRKFATGLAAGTHTVKITNTGDGETTSHLKLGRIIADGGLEINEATTDENGDHVPASMPENLVIDCQIPDFHSSGNSGVVYTEYADDYTSNGGYTVRKMTTSSDLTAGGSWGSYGINFARATEESHKGILYDNYTAAAGTYVFKARVRTLAGTPTIGATTVKSWVPTYDAIYGRAGYAPTAEWSDYKTVLTHATDGFTVSFGIMNASAGDSIAIDVGDGVYYAPEVKYDVKVEITGENKSVSAGGTNTVKATMLNQLGIPAETSNQEFTWSIVDGNGNTPEEVTITPSAESNTATISATENAEIGTYYVKAVSSETNWQKTLPIEVVEGPVDPYAKDYVPGAIPENLTDGGNAAGSNGGTWTASDIADDLKVGAISAIKIQLADDRTDKIDSNWYATGIFLVDKNKLSEEGTAARALYPESNKNYVFKTKLRSAEGNARVGLANNNTWGNYDIGDHGTDGVLIGTDWTEFKTSIAIEDVSEYRFNYMSFGIVKGSKDDYIVYDASTIYFAEEVPHSVNLTPVSDDFVLNGEEATFNAELLNQIGVKGYLDQNAVTFTVGNDRGDAIEGLTVTADGATATVSATDEVAEGEYYLRANYAIDENTTWTKTLAIDVIKGIEDSSDFVQPEKPANMVTLGANGEGSGIGACDANWYGGNGSSTCVVEDGHTGKGTLWKSTAEHTINTWYGAGPFYISSSTATGMQAIEGGKDYVFSIWAKDVSDETVTAPMLFTSAFGTGGSTGGIKYSNEYPKGTYATLAKDWTEYTATYSFPLGYAGSKSLYVGYPANNVQAYAGLAFLVDDFYFAEEVAYEFNVTASAESVEKGGEIVLDATLLNQLGKEGTLSQDFTWVAITDDRINYLEGFTFEADAEDASKVTVSVAEDVAPGEYLIVAQNAKEDVSKHYKLTVTEEVVEPVEFAITGVEFADSSATVSFEGIPAEGKSVVLYIAKYVGEVFNGAEIKPITLTGELATDSKTESFIKADGETVKAFIWDLNMNALLETPATN